MERCLHCGRRHGELEWCVVDENGKFHSYNDEPSYRSKMNRGNYSLCWHQHGKLHRVDGPAILYVYPDKKTPSYYLNGIMLSLVPRKIERSIWESLKEGQKIKFEKDLYILFGVVESHNEGVKIFHVLQNAKNKILVAFHHK